MQWCDNCIKVEYGRNFTCHRKYLAWVEDNVWIDAQVHDTAYVTEFEAVKMSKACLYLPPFIYPPWLRVFILLFFYFFQIYFINSSRRSGRGDYTYDEVCPNAIFLAGSMTREGVVRLSVELSRDTPAGEELLISYAWTQSSQRKKRVKQDQQQHQQRKRARIQYWQCLCSTLNDMDRTACRMCFGKWQFYVKILAVTLACSFSFQHPTTPLPLQI